MFLGRLGSGKLRVKGVGSFLCIAWCGWVGAGGIALVFFFEGCGWCSSLSYLSVWVVVSIKLRYRGEVVDMDS